MQGVPTHHRVLRLGALLWIAHGLLVGATPVSRTHARAPLEAAEELEPSASLEVLVVDERGAPQFARVTALDESGRSVEALARGDAGARLAVAAGLHAVRASRGPEWSIAKTQLRAVAGRRVRAILSLHRELDPGGYVGCDFHLHGEHSPDSEIAIADRVASIAAEGLEFAVPTEHNAIASYERAPFGSLPGVELTTWAPSVGHFNVFPARYVPEHRGRSPDELFAELRADPRVVIQVNHPRLEDHIAYFHLGRLDGEGALTAPSFTFDFDVLEVWNGYDLARPERLERVLREWLTVLAAGHRITATGNSDSHDLSRQRPGYPRTYVWTGGRDAQVEPELVPAALKAGQAFVTSGPLLHVEVNGQRPGGTVETDNETVTLKARVQAASWMRVDTLTVWSGTRAVKRVPIAASEGALDVTLELELTVENATFLVVTVSGQTPMDAIGARRGALPYGFANPVWIKPSASRATRQYSASPAKES